MYRFYNRQKDVKNMSGCFHLKNKIVTLTVSKTTNMRKLIILALVTIFSSQLMQAQSAYV